ncbi:hypothetical protein QE250_16890, partial [Chromatiaceae bacterium AAb-1]|nr:hypothetical protein [Chromatiaceae bacterium AAb-1]
TRQCIILEMPIDIYQEIKVFSGRKVTIHGVMLEHDYRDTDNGLLFIPSRISVKHYHLDP